jgi:activator of HSP90 ATPase
MRERNTPTRRQMIASTVTALGTFSCGYQLFAQTPQQSMKDVPSTPENKTRTSLHQEVDLKANPQRIYEILLDSKLFAAFTGMPAEIDPKAGGAFSLFEAMIVGRNIELDPAQRIVQAWRPANWPAGLYSLVRFELKSTASGSTVLLDHSSFPQGGFDHLSQGWNEHYWEPLKKFLA